MPGVIGLSEEVLASKLPCEIALGPYTFRTEASVLQVGTLIAFILQVTPDTKPVSKAA